jgi:hypothetical protein
MRFGSSALRHQSAFAHRRFRGEAAHDLPLVTADERARLLAHGAALAAGQRLDPLPVVRCSPGRM